MTLSRSTCSLTHSSYSHARQRRVCKLLTEFIRHPERVSGARRDQIPQRKESVYDPHQSASHLWVKAPIYHFIRKKYGCDMPWALPNDLFFPPARSRLIPVYSRERGASDICLKVKPRQAVPFFFLCGRSKTQQTTDTAETRFELNYKRQLTLISHKLWQLLSTCKEIVGGHT